jgi:NAD(P)-dependent dehydrogenase (short-subunit alcohol dehydrogenase family)
MNRFSNKVALITGGNSGLGKATAEAFAREGATVVIAARREGLGRDVEASIRASGGEATFVRCDITDEADVRALVDRVVETYGRLDYAYNHAWAAPQGAPLADLPTDRFDHELALLRGTFLCMKYEIPVLASGGGGAIVNCSSLATQLAQHGLGAYAAAKAGLEMLARTAAHEYASKNIRVNAIVTGAFETPGSAEYVRQLPQAALDAFYARIALKRLARPAELAEAVLFLCSDASAYITGTSLLVDGGYRVT